ncbi:MAG: phospholipase [Cytophagaceae bacterium]|nr:phospholipase [Cytophagaceae bacterium]
MQIHSLPVTRTARYCTLGELSADTENVWFVCHGYGQLAPYFIKKFEPILDSNTFIVAPEALSRFYLEGFSGRVGATWMTREERTSEISDYVTYLDQLYQHTLGEYADKDLKINVLGFSQGCATVCRWVMGGRLRFDKLVLWAGYFGNGIRDVLDPDLVRDKAVIYVYGIQDELAQNFDTNQQKTDLLDAIPHLQLINFEGGHTIEAHALRQVANN